MKCTSCGTDNIQGATFCAYCGSTLPAAKKKPAHIKRNVVLGISLFVVLIAGTGFALQKAAQLAVVKAKDAASQAVSTVVQDVVEDVNELPFMNEEDAIVTIKNESENESLGTDGPIKSGVLNAQGFDAASAEDEVAMKEAIEVGMEKLTSGDSAEFYDSVFNDSSEIFGVTISGDQLIRITNALFKDSTYTVDNVEVSGDQGRATLTVTMKDLSEISEDIALDIVKSLLMANEEDRSTILVDRVIEALEDANVSTTTQSMTVHLIRDEAGIWNVDLSQNSEIKELVSLVL